MPTKPKPVTLGDPHFALAIGSVIVTMAVTIAVLVALLLQ